MKSLYVKYAVTTISIMLISSILAFMFSNFYYQQKLKLDNDQKNTEIALNITSYIEETSGIQLEDYLDSVAKSGYHFYLINEANQEQYFGDLFRNKQLPDKTKTKVLSGDIYHGIAEFPRETFITGFFANELSNTIGVPFEYNEQQYALFMRPNIKLLFNEMHILFAWLLVLTIVLSIICVAVTTKFMIQPIAELTTATKDLSEGNFSIELDINRDDELGELATSFTNMAKQLEKLDELKNEFISNVSHDIKSPLANIKGYANLLEKDTLSREEKTNYVSVINNEINRLSTLTEQLLLIASFNHQEGILNKTTYSLSEQIKEIIFNHQWLINKEELMISYSLPEQEIYGDEGLLYNVWENLLTNAIKYNTDSGSIHISSIETETSIEVSFIDSGIGFSKAVQERIFDSFYREDSARSATVEGTGLGLAIVSSIIKLHEGTIQVESEVGAGTTFTVTLPKNA